MKLNVRANHSQCATLLLSVNVNPKVVQEILGHANIYETMDTYSHALPSMQEAAVNAMEGALSWPGGVFDVGIGERAEWRTCGPPVHRPTGRRLRQPWAPAGPPR